ncbi:hypothetical protein NEUTE1DRAFT_130919 [Neurospora tetrasperma FGSC 2508]|uniref:FAD/NAD(P)-binding domain-containing protein n=1 Tax=Neurospora tetrasperma (strain FGSC 2508 / ATCC MYA-4615 / P0657) TaxID=510951 RepID=F8MS13_NEUT8|nr:uncharacterized protein NEUTE1DRAFT_130919 [Neurospora tetrasperma FGSC 2508]EGO55007.1 hypothetical protein NEUTE1DRAFT_130919 [Neurospora tetrasperma FGSC 2508]EGZ69791.1 hypothetical protein NEUTE2DRAFT_160130 [Neurospora tetrasperma FGSC 2509]
MASTEPQSTLDAVPEPQSTAAPAPTTTTPTTPLPTSIVILGGNLAGLGVLHNLARHTIPALQRLPSQPQYKITLITPNNHFFFKPASPRALIHPDLLPGGEKQIFRDLSDAVKQYGELVTVVKAYATDVDTSKKEVTIKHVHTNSPSDSEGTSAVRYDVLVIATGTKARSALWTMPGQGTEGLHAAEDATKREWERFRTKLKNLQAGTHPHHSILIAGGGPVGVETTGEIATLLKAMGKTEGVTITLLSGSDRLLNRNCNESLGRKAEAYLKKNFGSLVEVKHGIKVVSVSDSVIPGEGGVEQHETTVELSDGTTRTVGLYIDATGGSGNADGFLPLTWLDASSRVITKDDFFRVRGSGSSEETDHQANGIYAVGDVVSGSDNTLISTNFQVPVVCSSIGVDLATKILHPEGGESQSSGVKLPAALKQKTFKNKMAGTLLVPIGPGGGVGQILGWGVPSLMVKTAKAKNFLVDMIEPAVTGSQWK